jgi:hypothetical protein
MIWVSWRQRRSQAITGLGLLCALAVYGLVLGLQMRNSVTSPVRPAGRAGQGHGRELATDRDRGHASRGPDRA